MDLRGKVAESLQRNSVKSDDGCRLWQAHRNPQGYGQVRDARVGRVRAAHRVSYEIAVGPIPPGKFVCHSCDNPSCINPEHLWLGTAKENMRDMARKGRGRGSRNKGTANPSAKIDEAAAQQIRALRGKLSQRRLAQHFGVSQSMICLIQKGRHWA